MDDVLDLAKQLGQTMRDHSLYKRLRDAEGAVQGNEDSLKLAGALAQLNEEVARADAEGKDVGDDFRERAGKIQAAVQVDPLLQELAAAQNEFQDMVNKVRETMLSELNPE
ncbi:MAG: YlbF family regulator [Planctomycetota bacterium]|jgi:cell fate (sporulation/competence/biofilm development) regulator YlbF (YheA/YmcA/DUF963 family)